MSTQARHFTFGGDSSATSLSVRNVTKFYLRKGREYLHWSAKKLTPNRAEAWIGTERQAINCIVKFPAAKGCSLAGLD